jgi:hypothetical protein
VAILDPKLYLSVKIESGRVLGEGLGVGFVVDGGDDSVLLYCLRD